jgi:hypothetical protein
MSILVIGLILWVILPIILLAILRFLNRRIVTGRIIVFSADGEWLSDGDLISRGPWTLITFRGIMIEEYDDGDVRVLGMEDGFTVVCSDPPLGRTLPCGDIIRTGTMPGRCELTMKARRQRFSPLGHGPMAEFVLEVVPGPVARIRVRMVGRPAPTV